MTSMKRVLRKVDENLDLVDKWYEISEQVGKHVLKSRKARDKLMGLNRQELNAFCKDFMTECDPDLEEAVGVSCIRGLNEYIDEDVKNPSTGTWDDDRAFSISVNFDICSETIAEGLHGEKGFEEWDRRSYEEAEPAEGVFGELGAKKSMSSWRDKI